jgi:hypothetical protein
MESRNDRQYLQLPEQTLTTLSFCEPAARDLNAWVNSLPLANIGETARQLYHAVIEFNQLKLSDQSRFDLLELIRHPVHYVCNALNRRYLTQSVVLDDGQRKIANLAQALQTHLAIGYKLIVEHHLEQGAGKPKDVVAKALHRTMSDTAPNILRSYQLYLRTPPGIWHEIHQLYQVAVALNLTRFKLADEQGHTDVAMSLQDVYCRILLLGTCQPNQLHQRDLAEIYQALETWSAHVSVCDIADEKSTLVVNPESDSGPIYRHLLKPQAYADYMGIHTSSLVRGLHKTVVEQQDRKSPVPENGIRLPDEISNNLAQHLVQSWGGMKQRAFTRTPATGNVEIAVGVIATHFHISGGVGFYKQLNQNHSSPRDNPFLGGTMNEVEDSNSASTTDTWSVAFGADKAQVSNMHWDEESPSVNFGRDDSESQPKYEAELVNTSPRGYCVRWKGKIASNLQTGEMVAIRDAGSSRWNLGVIRWIRQAANEGAQLGFELIAPNAQPCAIRVLHKTGSHGDYMRGLLVPEIKTIGQAASLIAPNIPFQVGNKIGLNLQGKETRFQLLKRLQGTSTFNQFQIRSYDSRPVNSETQTQTSSDDSFESLWRQL